MDELGKCMPQCKSRSECIKNVNLNIFRNIKIFRNGVIQVIL